MSEHVFIKRQRVNLKQQNDSLKQRQQAGAYPFEFQMPTGLQFELTASCNLRCKHCYNRSGDPDVLTRMTPADWIALSHHIVDNGGIFQCILSGGEPLLMGDTLTDIMDILDADGTAFLLISNGALMNDAWIARLKKYRYFWIQISLDDSRREKHDEFRGRVGTWDAAVQVAIKLSAAGLPLKIAHTITPDNLDRLPEMVELAYQVGASTIICGETIVSGRAAQNEQLWFNEEQRNEMYTQIDALQKVWRNKIILQYTVPENIQLQSRDELPNRAVIIRPNGDVRLDCTVPFTIGNVLERPFVEIWREKGINCWKHPAVQEYIQNLTEGKLMPEDINYVTKDMRL